MLSGPAAGTLTEEVGNLTKRRLLQFALLLGVLLFQVVLWQIAVVQMAHFHTEMNYRTAVDLLDNRPLTFYGILAIPLLVSNAAILLWCVYGSRLGRRQNGGSAAPPGL